MEHIGSMNYREVGLSSGHRFTRSHVVLLTACAVSRTLHVLCCSLCFLLNFLCIFTALHAMQTRSSDENSVCLSVYRVNCDKTEEISVQIFIPYERQISLVYLEEEWLLGGRPLLPEILGQLGRIGVNSPILNR